MSTSHERITQALNHLTTGLFPFVEREMKAVYRDTWLSAARESFRDDRNANAPKGEVVRWDAHALLTVLWDQWNKVFRTKLGHSERSLVSELRDFRNRWAHQGQFTFDDQYRTLDSVERLLRACGAKEADAVAREKRDLMRREFSQETRAAYQKSQANRKKWQDIALYGACSSSILFAVYASLGIKAWLLMAIVVTVFAYLCWHRATSTQPLLFAAHECAICGKIIYSSTCPYCEPTTATPAAIVAPLPTPLMEEAEELAGK